MEAKFSVSIWKNVCENFSHKWISKLLVFSPNNLLRILRDSK